MREGSHPRPPRDGPPALTSRSEQGQDRLSRQPPPIASSWDDELEDDVEALARRCLEKRGVGVVDDPIRAGGVHAVAAEGAGRRRDVSARALGELDRDAPDAAARAVDEDALAVLEPRMLEQCLPSAEPCDGECCGGARLGRQRISSGSSSTLRFAWKIVLRRSGSP
jgi:hypothetical protein